MTPEPLLPLAVTDDMKTRYGKVAVIYGGTSAEREISLMSGSGVLNALRSRGVDAHPFDPAESTLWQLHEQQFNRAFLALHGRGGEDGTIQGALTALNLPYTGSGVMGSAIGMDKLRTKLVWQALGIPTPAYALLTEHSDFEAIERQLGLPIMVKPAHEGSSIGITKVTESGQLKHAYQLAAQCDALVIAEAFVHGQEYTAPVLGQRALPFVRIEAPEGRYDYQNKYFSDETRYICPCELPETIEKNIAQIILRAFQAVGARAWGRIDFMLDHNQNPWLLEINTAPGMTSHSLVPMSARAVGISYEDLCLTVLDSSLNNSLNPTIL